MSQQLEAALVVIGFVFVLMVIVALAILVVALRYEWQDHRARRAARTGEPLTSRPRLGMSNRYSA